MCSFLERMRLTRYAAPALQPYRVLELPGLMAPENREPLGSKSKIWLRHQTDAEAPRLPRLLFKYNRDDKGEDWSEKIAAELAGLIGLPHAEVELATYNGDHGVAIVDFANSGGLALFHGNELFELADPSYANVRKKHGALQHTPAAVLSALSRISNLRAVTSLAPPSGVTDAFGFFVGYLMLDALIGNTDRHHENWGILAGRAGRRFLAPSYDHASSLGRELTDAKRTAVGHPRHGSPVERYVRRARSAFYASDGSGRQLSPVEAFLDAAQFRPEAAAGWLERLAALTTEEMRTIVEMIPDSRMTLIARAFTCALLEHNARILLAR